MGQLPSSSNIDNSGINRVLVVDQNGTPLLLNSLIAGVDYDYLDVQQTDSDTETYVYKIGGAGGTTVLTVTVNYTNSDKTVIDNVSWS